MPPLRAVLFDLDGTLVDSAPAICDAAAASLRELGHEVDASEVRPHLGAPLDELYREFTGRTDEAGFVRFRERYIAHHDDHPELVPTVYRGVHDMLTFLRSRYLLGVATTKPTDRAHRTLHDASLLSLVHHPQGTDEGMRAKPHPDVILAACAALDVRPAEVLMVGDTERDIVAAHRAGARSVAISHHDDHHARAAGFGAHHHVTEMDGLYTVLEAIGA